MLGTYHMTVEYESTLKSAATGGSAMKAVEVLMEHGVSEDRIIFINLVRSNFGNHSLTLIHL